MKNKYYYKDGSVLGHYDENKTLHRVDGQACVRYHENGKVFLESYYLEGKRHREDGPAYVSYYENGEVECERYWLEGELHRVDGPAHVTYYENGEVAHEEYYLEDKPHREDGPAHVTYYESGKVRYETYNLEDREYTKEEYYKILEEVKNMEEALRLTDPRKWVRKMKSINNEEQLKDYSLSFIGILVFPS